MCVSIFVCVNMCVCMCMSRYKYIYHSARRATKGLLTSPISKKNPTTESRPKGVANT